MTWLAVPLYAHAEGLSNAEIGALFAAPVLAQVRSEEHTSELQSLAYLVCRLLLEKKKILRKDRQSTHLTHNITRISRTSRSTRQDDGDRRTPTRHVDPHRRTDYVS